MLEQKRIEEIKDIVAGRCSRFVQKLFDEMAAEIERLRKELNAYKNRYCTTCKHNGNRPYCFDCDPEEGNLWQYCGMEEE